MKKHPSISTSSHLMQNNILRGSLPSRIYRVAGSPSILALGAAEYNSSDIRASKHAAT